MPTHPTRATVRRLLTAAAVVWLLPLAPAALAADDATGETDLPQAVRRVLSWTSGEGVKGKYGKPMVGDCSVEQLAQLIGKSMPKDDGAPGVGADANKVAAYPWRILSKAARIELSRLTVHQHQNAIADLIAGSHASAGLGRQAVWNGEYSATATSAIAPWSGSTPRSVSTSRRTAPIAGKIRAGGVLHPLAGVGPCPGNRRLRVHQAAPRTAPSCRGKNDIKRPLIDAAGAIRRGKRQLGTVHLLGGHAYPLRLDFFKSKEAKEQTASISLQWTPPFGVAGPIPGWPFAGIVAPKRW